MKKAVLVTDMSSFTSSTESRGIIHVGAKIFALRELLLPLMRSYGAQARSATGKPADILLVHYCPCGIVHLSRTIPARLLQFVGGQPVAESLSVTNSKNFGGVFPSTWGSPTS